MLSYLVELHERSTHPPSYPFKFSWEGIGPGYVYGPGFGHFDIVHIIMDTMTAEPKHARQQILNNLTAQLPNGLVPGVIWMPGSIWYKKDRQWNPTVGHATLWESAVQEYFDIFHEKDIIQQCYLPLIKQIDFFEKNRKADDGGFFYQDILTRDWESGVDEGVRYDNAPKGKFTCIDATSHVYWMYEHAANWARMLGKDSEGVCFAETAANLKQFIQDELFDNETGFFHDIWSVGRPEKRHLAYEGMWPVVVGVATVEQANRVIDENLLNPDRFFTKHPISTVAKCDPKFELRFWRGGSLNSMAYWAARGCMSYSRFDATVQILEAALDDSAAQFERTGTIWEFYHPFGGRPEDVERKPWSEYHTPCRDYIGHNPLIAMTKMWEKAKTKT